MDDLQTRASKKISALIDKNQLRSLKNLNSNLIDFVSNDYLGLARSEELYNLILRQVESLTPHLNGATGSRLLSGNSNLVEAVEQRLASIFKGEAALIFNSGYSANLGLLSCLPQKGDTIFYDELSHACIKDGARLSLSNRYSFRHNNLDDLRSKLKTKTQGLPFVVVESIYSMDGDESPLSDLVGLCREFGAIIILDEAHSTGIFGRYGSGLAVSLNLEKDIGMRVYTFGKAMGIHGACVVCSKTLKDYLVNFARPFIYTTALPPHSIIAIDCAFKFLKENQALPKILKQKIALFKENCSKETKSSSPIQPVLISGNEEARKAAASLVEQGFDVRPILSPTVKSGTERLRICLHAFNEDQSIINLAQSINKMYLKNSHHTFS